IQQRNSVAGEYNAELGEINSAVGRAASEPEAEYNYYKDLLTRSDSELSEYQKALKEQIKEDRRQEEWETELAQALEIASMRSDGSGSSSRRQLVRDSNTGEPL